MENGILSLETSFHTEYENLVPRPTSEKGVRFRTLSKTSFMINRAAKDVFDPKLRKNILLAAMTGTEFKKIDFDFNGMINLFEGQEDIVRFLFLHPRCKNSPFFNKKEKPLWEMHDDTLVKKVQQRATEMVEYVADIIHSFNREKLGEILVKYEKNALKNQPTKAEMQSMLKIYANQNQADFILKYGEDKEARAIATIHIEEVNARLIYSLGTWKNNGKDLLVVREDERADMALIDAFRSGKVKSTYLDSIFNPIFSPEPPTK